MPVGADTVFMQEDVRLDASGNVILPPGLKAGANVRPMGEDFAEGVTALPAGRRMRPQDVVLAAALGLTQIEVRRRIRVAVFSTGDEIVSPGSFRGAAQLFDSNRFMLIAMAARFACEVSDLGILRDDRASLAGALRQVRTTSSLRPAACRLAKKTMSKRRSRLSDRLCYGVWPSSRDVQLRWASSRGRRSSVCLEIRWQAL